jgi:hypothetical protein
LASAVAGHTVTDWGIPVEFAALALELQLGDVRHRRSASCHYRCGSNKYEERKLRAKFCHTELPLARSAMSACILAVYATRLRLQHSFYGRRSRASKLRCAHDAAAGSTTREGTISADSLFGRIWDECTDGLCAAGGALSHARAADRDSIRRTALIAGIPRRRCGTHRRRLRIVVNGCGEWNTCGGIVLRIRGRRIDHDRLRDVRSRTAGQSDSCGAYK